MTNSTDLIATVLPGGHVTYELYEDVKGDGRCVCCGQNYGRLCPGIPDGCPPDARRLFAIVRGMLREAPNDRPNGYPEAALQVLYDAHVKVINQHDGQRMIVNVADVKAEGDAAHYLGERLADQDRALGFALAEYESSQRQAANYEEAQAHTFACRWCGNRVAQVDAKIEKCPVRDGDLHERMPDTRDERWPR